MKEILLAIKEWILWKLSTEDYNKEREEIEFLRKLVEEGTNERAFLLEQIKSLSIPVPVVPVEFDENIQPIVNKKFIPWHLKRQQLEMEDRNKALKVNDEAKMALNRGKSTEQLEKEILEGVE